MQYWETNFFKSWFKIYFLNMQNTPVINRSQRYLCQTVLCIASILLYLSAVVILSAWYDSCHRVDPHPRGALPWMVFFLCSLAAFLKRYCLCHYFSSYVTFSLQIRLFSCLFLFCSYCVCFDHEQEGFFCDESLCKSQFQLIF